ncbi:MAG TPA: 3-dehydroquinate synthase [Rhodothermales bacterium]
MRSIDNPSAPGSAFHSGDVLRVEQDVPIRLSYPVYFVEDLFEKHFAHLDVMLEGTVERPREVLFVIDAGVLRHHPHLPETLARRANEARGTWHLAGSPLVVPGGERSKNDPDLVNRILDRIHERGVDRHSYVVAIGGGAVLDLAGYAAAVAHRGIRLIRVPTTVLAQNDSGVGVKNGVNAYGKKNFVGTFAPPFAVFNDFRLLETLDDRDWRAGTSEAVKVALIKDPAFFDFLEESAARIAARDSDAMRRLIVRCAELHLDHIRKGGDPFEQGSSRPLDFGHWSAHKLEQLSDYEIRHGEAVAIGIALDCTYAHLAGILPEEPWQRVLNVLETLGFDLYAAELSAGIDDGEAAVFAGLEEFREHLGGELTILLIEDVGRPIEVHRVDLPRYRDAIAYLQERARTSVGA